LRYRPFKKAVFRIQKADALIDILRVAAAALSCQASLEISSSNKDVMLEGVLFEEDAQFIARIKKGDYQRVRLLSSPSKELYKAGADALCFLNHAPVLANGRFELLHYLREISISIDYHRYGNLQLREDEPRRSPL
jgi:RHH-type transcriptional regulator, proline utilization regulon repressor / proline dehydrogenase / delta 1-pyrroline-5-carboxylate dehydrogenase